MFIFQCLDAVGLVIGRVSSM